MPHELVITPSGHLTIVERLAPGEATTQEPLSKSIIAAFDESAPRGLLHLATNALQVRLPADLEYARSFAQAYLTRLCHTPAADLSKTLEPIPPPNDADLAAWILRAPPLTGLEYLSGAALASWWTDLDALVRAEAQRHPGGVQAYLTEKNPSWKFVGRVAFHLGENKRDPEHPFAFLASYASGLSSQGRVQHEPLGKALQHYAGARNRQALLNLLSPIQRASERSALVKEMLASGDIYRTMAWSPREAYQFLRDIPALEESGLIVRVPDWWKHNRPARPVVSVKVDGRRGSRLGADALLEFSVGVSLGGEKLSDAEVQELLSSIDGLVRLKGQWVEVDREKLAEALSHWKKVEADAQEHGLSFLEGMRLLSGAALERDTAGKMTETQREWTGLEAGPALEETLRHLRSWDEKDSPAPSGLRTQLRPYQQVGLGWLRFITRLGLGACLADDMGLGKTVQVIALLLTLKHERKHRHNAKTGRASLLVVPASLIANWKSEIQRFAPDLSFAIAHPSETSITQAPTNSIASNRDLVITTYGMLTHLDWLRDQSWDLVILDEAQAIKNAGTRQAHAAKELKNSGRIAMTGTPIENRLGDVWSLFDFLNPGLLGNAKEFSNFVKRMNAAEPPSYRPLRALIQPYILRRLKTDKRVISDLPDKVEVKAFCGLTRRQAALYEQSVRELQRKIQDAEGIQRRGLILSQLMRLKQICNHPSQLLGEGGYDPTQSGKFQRLAELCEELAQRQEKVLIFTQFREMTEPLAEFLKGVFGRTGLVLHGGTAVGNRRKLVEQFQNESGPPFFILSLKAGGTGLNLTAASQVIHFDRWWNPAVENQATDRAFRIGQLRNVLVHKFVCRGTVEEKIDELIESKVELAEQVISGAENLITEMSNEKLMEFVALDMKRATEF
jgi:non-specific serine/threonine protein kinase